MHLKLLYISQSSFENIGTYLPTELLSLFLQMMVCRYPWWDLKTNYRVHKVRHFKLLLDLNDDRVLNNLYEPADEADKVSGKALESLPFFCS